MWIGAGLILLNKKLAHSENNHKLTKTSDTSSDINLAILYHITGIIWEGEKAPATQSSWAQVETLNLKSDPCFMIRWQEKSWQLTFVLLKNIGQVTFPALLTLQ